MTKEECKTCEYLVECITVWYCEEMNLPIDKFYECPNKENKKQLFNMKGKKDVY